MSKTLDRCVQIVHPDLCFMCSGVQEDFQIHPSWTEIFVLLLQASRSQDHSQYIVQKQFNPVLLSCTIAGQAWSPPSHPLRATDGV